MFPYVVVSPAYFAGSIQLGGLMQTASAFSSVQGALSFFVSSAVYRQLAEWRAVIAAARRLPARGRGRSRGRGVAAGHRGRDGRGQRGVQIDDVAVNLPDGKPLVAGDGLAIPPGDRVLVTGPSGSGKSTLFRAIAGIWPFGKGRIVVPQDAQADDAAAAALFPGRHAGRRGDLSGRARHVRARDGSPRRMRAVGLPALAERLDEEAHWNRMLSLGEQQRLGIARALLQAPDYLFLDEATASLDEASEAALYQLLQERLPKHHARFDRPPLDAQRVPPPPVVVRARRRAHRVRETAIEAAR